MLRMKSLLWALGLLAIAAVCRAQTFADQEHALKDALHNKTLYIKGFSAEKEVHFVWTGTSLGVPNAPIHTLGALKIKNVKVTSGSVEIDGERSTLMKKPGGGFGLSDTSDSVK